MDIYSRILMRYGWNAPPVSPRRHVRQQVVSINIDTRLNNRMLDLRTPANQAILRINAAVGRLFREYLVRTAPLPSEPKPCMTDICIQFTARAGSSALRAPYTSAVHIGAGVNSGVGNRGAHVVFFRFRTRD